MNYVKLTKLEKIKEREDRKELQLILKRCRDLGFNYLIFRPPKTKTSFGSITDREVLPKLDKKFNHLGPGTYNLTYFRNQDHPILRTKISKNGYSSLSFSSVRFNEVYDDNNCDFFIPIKVWPEKTFNQHFPPFGIGAKRNLKLINSTSEVIPGPGTYYSNFKRKLIFKCSFGGRINVEPAVEMICTTENLSSCSICNQRPIVGDYWKNYRSGKELCRSCMDCKRNTIKKSGILRSLKTIKLRKCDEFRMVRYCRFYHDHQKTKAAVKLLKPQELKEKYRRENYLSIFNY